MPYLPDGQGIPKQGLLVFKQGVASGTEKWELQTVGLSCCSVRTARTASPGVCSPLPSL